MPWQMEIEDPYKLSQFDLRRSDEQRKIDRQEVGYSGDPEIYVVPELHAITSWTLKC